MTNLTEHVNAADHPSREQRTPAEIEAEIRRTRAQLAGTIDEIADRVHPKHVAKRGAGRVKAAVVGTDSGSRKPRIAAAAGATVVVLAVMMWRRRH